MAAVVCGCGATGAAGAAGRKRVEEHFTVERTAQGVMAVWDRLLGQRREEGGHDAVR